MKSKLPEGWEEVKLGEVINLRRGHDLTRKNMNSKGIYSVIGSNGIIGAHDKYIIEGPVVTVGRSGNVGKPFYYENNAWPHNTTLYIDDFKSNNPYYIYCLLETLGLENYRGGSAVPTLNRNHIHPIDIIIPPLAEQKKIADTLSSLDDKIELNNKINENLEKQAQAIFKHWFIDFEFPDENENPYKSSGGEMIESELGMIPKGWGVDSLGKNKLGKLVSSGIDKFEGEKIYLATADVSGVDIVNSSTLVTLENRPSRANMQPKTNTVWFAKMKDSRKLILVDKIDIDLKKDYIFSTGFAGIQCTESSVYYLWTYIQSETFDIIKNSLSMGTTMQAINNGNINKIKILIPEKHILEKFNKVVARLYKRVLNSRNQNNYLAKLRDALLPKLMSGELRIPLD